MLFGSYIFGLGLVLMTAALSIAGLMAVRRKIGLETLASWHEVAGYLLSVVGTMYAVLLGLIVVDAMTRFQNARAETEQEANALADVFLLSERMPQHQRERIQLLSIKYADAVIEKEWPSMERRERSIEARNLSIQLVRAVSDFEPATESEKAIYPIMVTEALSLWDSRRARIITAINGIPFVEWAVVIIGGVVTIVFTYFFGLRSLMSQIAMTSMVAVVIALNVYLILLFGYPYAGDLKVTPEAFEIDRKIFQGQIGMDTQGRRLQGL